MDLIQRNFDLPLYDVEPGHVFFVSLRSALSAHSVQESQVRELVLHISVQGVTVFKPCLGPTMSKFFAADNLSNRGPMQTLNQVWAQQKQQILAVQRNPVTTRVNQKSVVAKGGASSVSDDGLTTVGAASSKNVSNVSGSSCQPAQGAAHSPTSITTSAPESGRAVQRNPVTTRVNQKSVVAKGGASSVSDDGLTTVGAALLEKLATRTHVGHPALSTPFRYARIGTQLVKGPPKSSFNKEPENGHDKETSKLYPACIIGGPCRNARDILPCAVFPQNLFAENGKEPGIGPDKRPSMLYPGWFFGPFSRDILPYAGFSKALFRWPGRQPTFRSFSAITAENRAIEEKEQGFVRQKEACEQKQTRKRKADGSVVIFSVVI